MAAVVGLGASTLTPILHLAKLGTVFRLPSQLSTFASALFRLALVVSIWSGPLPWGHDHALDGEALAEHLARFHSCDADPLKIGWHWHYSLPGHSDESSEDQQGPASAGTTVMLPAHPSGELGQAVALDISLAPIDWHASPTLGDHAQLPSLAFAPSLSSARLQLLCCMRC